MRGLSLYVVGYGAGVVTFVAGRGVLALRDVHRAALRREHHEAMSRLLSPYEHTGLRAVTIRRG